MAWNFGCRCYLWSAYFRMASSCASYIITDMFYQPGTSIDISGNFTRTCPTANDPAQIGLAEGAESGANIFVIGAVIKTEVFGTL